MSGLTRENVKPHDQRQATSGQRTELVASASVMLLAGVVYSLTLCSGVFPGTSATLLATYTGLEPLIAPTHPIWGFLVNMIGGMGDLSGMALRLNIFSMLIGVISTGMMCSFVIRLISYMIDVRKVARSVADRAALFGGLTAAVAFAFSVPIWMCSTRLQYQIFDIFMLLVLAHVFFAYVKSRRTTILLFFSFLFGVTVVENVIALLFGIVFGIYIFALWVRDEDIRLMRIVFSLIALLLGLSFYFVWAKIFSANTDLSLFDYNGVGDVVHALLVEQIRALQSVIPRQRWLLLLLFVVFPWIGTLIIAPRALNENREWSMTAFHLVMTILAIVTLSNVAVVSPICVYRDLNLFDVIPTTLYSLTAMVVGYLVAYWYIAVANRKTLLRQVQRQLDVTLNAGFGRALGWILVVVVAFTALINAVEADGRRGNFADECTRDLLANLEGRRWIISNGILDNHITVAAARNNQKVTCIPLVGGDMLTTKSKEHRVYFRRIEELIEKDPEFQKYSENQRVRMRNALRLGVSQFIQDWVEIDPGLVDRMAVIHAPDLLISIGCKAVPNFLCFIGERDASKLREIFDETTMAKYREFWSKMVRELKTDKIRHDSIAIYRSVVRRQVGLVANNMGVVLEDLGRNEEAFQVYKTVRVLDPENISSLLNMAGMLNRLKKDKFHEDEIAGVERDVKELLTTLKHRIHIWALARTYGYVRDPMAFAQLGWSWALSGQPNMALEGLRRAEELSTTDTSRAVVKNSTAAFFFARDDVEKSEKLYLELLENKKESDLPNQKTIRSGAMLKLSQIALKRNDVAKSREWLKKADDEGADRFSIKFHSAVLDLHEGRNELARIKLMELTDLAPRSLRVLGLLAVAEIGMKDLDDVRNRILPKMETIAGTPDDFNVLVTRAQLALASGYKNLPDARAAFDRASQLRPGETKLVEQILQLDFLMGDQRSAEIHAANLLKTDRNNYFANYILGSLMLQRESYSEAEDYFRRSIEAKDAAAPRNDYAVLLHKTGRLTEAEEQVRKAIELGPDLFAAWDTLGEILTQSGRLDEAEEAFLTAIEVQKKLKITKKDLRISLNYAQLLFKKGNLIKSREVVAEIRPKSAELPPEDQTELKRLIEALKSGGN